MMSEGDLTAELRGRQWTVRDADGQTVGWISPASGRFVVSQWVSSGGVLGQFLDVRSALEALAATRGAPQ